MHEVRSHSIELAIVILAAGASSRLGQPKQLIHAGGQNLLQHQISIAETLNVPVVVVLGAQANTIKETINSKVEVVVNPQWQEGMSASVRLAVETVNAQALLFMTVDQYRVQASHLQSLAQSWRKHKDKIVCSSYDGILGVPAVIPSTYEKKLLGLSGDRGAGAVIREANIGAPDRVLGIAEDLCAFDLDTQSDLSEFHNHYPFENLKGHALCIE